MKRKLIYIGFSFLILTIIGIFIQSCNDIWSSKARICDIEFTGINPSYNNSPDEFTSEIGFVIIANNRGDICYAPLNLNIISTCSAMTKCAKWKNEITIPSFKLSLDKKIIIAGDTVPANNDLFQNPTFNSGVTSIKDKDDCKYIKIEIKLSADLLSKMTFEQGVYNVNFTCSTNDSKTFNKQRLVIFKK